MSLAKKLQKIVLRDTGVEIDLPASINRGYWQTGQGAFRWQAKETHGSRMFVSEDSMSKCVKFGVAKIREPFPRWHTDWLIDANEA